MKYIMLLFFLSFYFCSIGQASFQVDVSEDEVLLGHSLKVSFVLENSKGTDFEAPGFEDFTILSGPSSSSSYSIINGQVTQRQSYTYILSPKKEGTVSIGPAKIRSGYEDVLFTNPYFIEVLPNPDGIQEPSRRNEDRSFFDNPFFRDRAPIREPQKRRKRYRI